MFEFLKTGIDGLDAILGGGIRYPAESSAFVFATGGAGSGKTILALEMLTRAWLDGEDGTTFLYYSVEHSPKNLFAKLQTDFDFFGAEAEILELEQEVPHKVCLEARTPKGRTRMVLTQADTSGLMSPGAGSFRIDVDWILAEIGNYDLGGKVGMVCIDNVGLLLTDLDYFAKRAKLLETRRALMSKQIHGIFVREESDADLRLPSAEEFSTDLLLHLSFLEVNGVFKARVIEILKARHQYYYRGHHHFSIAGRGIQRDVYLGARNERGPGLHIYPSVAAQLSIARDHAGFRVAPRGVDPIDLGHPDLNAAFHPDYRPTANSSTILLAEPGTRYTFLALRFLAAAAVEGEQTLLVSTKEDREALRSICADRTELLPCLQDDGNFNSSFRVLYLHPEFISTGKFAWDIMRMAQGGHGHEGQEPLSRMVFDNVFQLQSRFPLLDNQQFMVRALLDLLRYQGVTPFFVDLVPPGTGHGLANINPSPYLTTFDNVLHLYLDESDGEARPYIRVLKSMAMESLQPAVPLRY